MVCINFGAMTKFISKIIDVIFDNLTLSCYHHFRVAVAKLNLGLPSISQQSVHALVTHDFH